MNEKPFYAVFIKSSYQVEGDERSRTNPGHGYPAHSVEYTNIQEFSDEQALKNWIVKNDESYSPDKYRAVKCLPIVISKQVQFDVIVADSKGE